MKTKHLDPSDYATLKCGGNNLYGWYELTIDDMHKLESEIYKLEEALDIAIKEIVFDLQHSDACNSLDDAYERVKEYIMDKAKKKEREVTKNE